MNIFILIKEVGLPLGILCIAYLFYDKNSAVSVILIVLAMIIIYFENYFKAKRHEAPWNFGGWE